ncbi:MAG: ABC transporter ATP-binding protein [Bacteroidales bacterium]|nr:ABC transporter ATP-binding protein [Bacteroidales bacterium]
MIIAKKLSKQYGSKVALNNLDLHIKQGEIFALLGQNGAGKTTTINCFLGFIEPTNGEALITGLTVNENVLETKKSLAYIPENVMLYPNLTGVENLSFFSTLAGFSYTNNELKRFLDRVGLNPEAYERQVSSFSKGMRQKVGIAIAIAKNAKVLLLDEPTSGLDPKASNEFSIIIKELAEKGTSILMATHDIFRAKEVATRVGIMKQGELSSIVEAKKISANELEALYIQMS